MLITPILRLQLAELRQRERVEKRWRRHARRYLVHPVNALRPQLSAFDSIYLQLRLYPEKFFNFLRMSSASFDILLEVVRADLVRQDTHLRLALSPEQHLVVTLRYLASGETFQSLHYQFRMGKSTICQLVGETCQVLWTRLQPLHLPSPTQATWLEAAKGFIQNANFPNCVGAVDGKHVRIRMPSGSGSLYYNYKKFFSIILMAIVDSTYKFMAVDIGAYGQNNDSRVFRESNFGQALCSGSFNFPPPQPLPGTDGPPIPFVLVGDEAFLMCQNLLKPFSGRRLTPERRIFNYRLSRARRFVECSFGILTNKWRVLTTAIMVNPEKVDQIIKACVVLHNFVLTHDHGSVNIEDVEETPLLGFEALNLRAPASVLQIREHFLQYFLSPVGSIPWQADY